MSKKEFIGLVLALFLAICTPHTALFASATPPLVGFTLYIDADPADPSVFHVSVQLAPQGATLHNGCGINIDVEFTFLDTSNTPIEVQELNLSFFGNDVGLTFQLVVPTNMMQHYAITSCSDAVAVNICTNFYFDGGASCSNDANYYTCQVFINNGASQGLSLGSGGPVSYCENLVISNPVFELPLNADIHTGMYVCDAGRLVYAVPYGGCPPYSMSWEDPLGNPVDWFDAPEELWGAGGYYAGFEDIIEPVIAANQIGMYNVTITDANGNSLTAGYEITNLQSENSFDYTLEYINCEAILTVSPTPGVAQINGSWLSIRQDDIYSILPPSCTWPCTLTKTISQSGIYYIVVVKQNSSGIYCFTEASVIVDLPVLNVSLPETITVCSSSLPQQLSVEPQTGNSYVWTINGVNQVNNNPFITISSPGIYSLTVTDANGCTASATTTVVLFDPPTPQIIMTQNECTVTLTASGGNSYLWNNGSADEAIEVAAPNTYTVIATDANGCTAQAGYEVLPTDIAPTDFSGNYTVCAMETPLDQVNGNVETWGSATTNLRLAGTIIIPAGKTLSINNTTLFMVGQTTKFIVEKGGILRLENGAVLQGDNCAPQHWQGIRVQADHTISHPTVALVPDIATTGSPHHGVVYVRNAIIKDALVAIEDYNPTPPPPGGLDLPRGGSIIIIENQSVFENNLTGVLMNPYRPDPTAKYVQRSSIKDSYFQNNQAFINPAYPEYKYQLYLNSVNRVPIQGNLFSANPATLSLQNKGIGIKTVNSGVNITENTFLDLYKGIDVYNTLTSVSVTNIEHNTFTEVNKALTLNYVPYAVVSNNTFNVPTGTNSPHDTYGLYSLKSFGFLLTGNTFVTTALANNHTRAVVLNQTLFNQAAIAQIRQNTFTGGFIDATRFEDNCKSLQLNCNVYLNEPQRDWYLAPDAELDKQGECILDKTELSFHQHWHYLPAALYSGYSNYHVYNANPGFTLEIYHDDYEFSVPTYNEGSVDVFSCSSEIDMTIGENPSCTLFVPPYYGGVNEGCAYSGEALSRKIQDWQRAGETDSIIALLHCIAEDWSYKILVGTYIDRRMYPQALAALDSIPNTPQGNADFKAIYYAYIQLLTGSSGKNADAAFVLQQVALNKTDARQTMAESMFALLYGNSYLRTVQDNAANNTHFSSKPTFILAPNPANNSTAIYWHNALVVSSDVYITDIAGRIVKTYHNLQNGQQINTDNLPNGIYYVHAAALSATQKLVVVH